MRMSGRRRRRDATCRMLQANALTNQWLCNRAILTIQKGSTLHHPREREQRASSAAQPQFKDGSVYRICWWAKQGSNLRPPVCKTGALTAELFAHVWQTVFPSTTPRAWCP